MLPREIENYLKGENKRKKDTYERELMEWERSNQCFKKGTQTAGASTPGPKPEAPEYYHLCGAPSTSKNQIIRRLKNNGDLGLIINATELDMISGAIKQDYGKHDDVFRAAYHHESAATDYKVDGELIFVEVPRLALCLSGTPNQLPNFMHSMENGLSPVSPSTPVGHDGNIVRQPPSRGKKTMSLSTKNLVCKYWRCTTSFSSRLRKSR